MYYVMRASAPSLHRESTDSLIHLYAFSCILLYSWSAILTISTLKVAKYPRKYGAPFVSKLI